MLTTPLWPAVGLYRGVPTVAPSQYPPKNLVRKLKRKFKTHGSILARRLVCPGFPLHSGFVDVDGVVQMVRATGIHEARHSEVQFALAVQAFAYPNNVLSVWVYIASITPR